MSERSRLKILVVRPDRVGDVLLSTPVLAALRRHYPQAHLTFMVREGVVPLVRGLSTVDAVLIYDPIGRHFGWRGFFQLMKDLRQGGFRIVVNLQSVRKLAAAQFGAGIRYRVGPLSRIHSYLYYNRGLRQRRSSVEMHEADYNLQLLRRLGVRAARTEFETQLSLSPETRAAAKSWLQQQGWKVDETLVAVHPGMGGSALNWPEENYVELAATLIREGKRVLLTGGPLEGGMLERVRRSILAQVGAEEKARLIEYGGAAVGAIDFLAGLMSWAAVVVAPSTGPLHVAVAVGTPVVTFYPPIRVMSALRWGPYLKDSERASILVPDVYCGQDFKCRGVLCNYYPCMRGLTVDQALDEVRRQGLNKK